MSGSSGAQQAAPLRKSAGVGAQPVAPRVTTTPRPTSARQKPDGFFGRIRYLVDRVWSFVVLFAIARLIAGLVIIWFDGDFAWGIELTIMVAVAVVVYLGVALAVRRWSPPRRRIER